MRDVVQLRKGRWESRGLERPVILCRGNSVHPSGCKHSDGRVYRAFANLGKGY
jgi:hypothetical protein